MRSFWVSAPSLTFKNSFLIEKLATLMKYVVFTAFFLTTYIPVIAGPPFVTDDPEPVEYQHWEINQATLLNHDANGWNGAAALTDANYGMLPNFELTLQPSLALSVPSSGPTEVGYGDTELGIKYRFIQQTNWLPDVACYPLLELPTGSASRGLGAGHPQVYFPIWLQKDFGKWSTFGGGGYWVNPGAYNFNWWYVGEVTQYQVADHLALGMEIFHQTRQNVDNSSNTNVNVGGTWDLNDEEHILFSVGHTVQGQSAYIGYLGIQFTFGPK
jgi:hypothetical protein